MNRWSRSRRDLLKTLGVGAACLPLLHATRPLQAATTFPRRLMLVLQPNGMSIDIWTKTTPTTNLMAATNLHDVVSPLDAHRADLLMMPELGNPAYTGAGHGAYGTIFSGGPNNPAEEYWTPAVATLDQVCADAAAKNGANVAARTLPLQVLPDGGESRMGAFRAFYTGNDQPVTPEASPFSLADRLFAGKAMGDPVLDKLRAERKSILDYVGSDLERFGKKLGTEDRMSIAAHLTSIRDIEKQLSGLVGGAADCGMGPALGPAIDVKLNENYPKVLSLQFDLAAAALRCDVTRVVTVQLGNAFGGGGVFTWLGINSMGLEFKGGPRGWHDMAHREVNDGAQGCNVCAGTNDKQTTDKWFMSQYAALIDRFKKMPEGDGSVLNNSAIVWANHMENGANHNAHKLPWMIAGQGGGYFKTNMLLKPTKQLQKTNVMCELANMMGANLPFYGSPDYGAPLPEIVAG